jgi:DNA invertase Pin-like site-specific DNA recombinase
MQELVIAGRAKAVQYLRMSTEHQRYSIENQKAQIAVFAETHGYEIIDTYADHGRSGLTRKERSQLNRLLRDVTNPKRQFSTILVLDVSRWGRFQDADEHAAYEFLCRDMGVNVEYVSENFVNDDSFASSMMKYIKRIMAGEYSRDLSARTTTAHIENARRGQRQGAPINFGYRRLLVDANGHPKHELADGERKALASDRVMIIPGPPDEQEIVRHIFDLFLDGNSIASIVRHLNYSKTPSSRGTPWTVQKIKTILRSEIYTGTYVYNLTTAKLKTPRARNPSHEWVKVPICDGIISQEQFTKTRELLTVPRRNQSNSYSDEKMLAGLRRLLTEQGRLSAAIINACPYVPNVSTYSRKFGTLGKSYARIGYNASAIPPADKRPSRRNSAYTERELTDQLKRLLDENGFLTRELIEQSSFTACGRTFSRAFGSLREAYRAAGYERKNRNLPKAPPLDAIGALHRLKELFDEHGQINAALIDMDRSIPSSRWFALRFGSFAAACEKAGIEYDRIHQTKSWRTQRDYKIYPTGGEVPLIQRTAELPDEDLLSAVRQIFEKNGYINKGLIASAAGLPSIRCILKRYASLDHLYAAAGISDDTPRRRPLLSTLA